MVNFTHLALVFEAERQNPSGTEVAIFHSTFLIPNNAIWLELQQFWGKNQSASYFITSVDIFADVAGHVKSW